MPHDDEMSANIKEIEKLFGTHQAIKSFMTMSFTNFPCFII